MYCLRLAALSFGKVEPLCIVWFLKRAVRNPVWIGRFQAVSSGTLINKGLQGRCAGDALNTRGSGHLFLEMRLRFCPASFQFSLYGGDSPKGQRGQHAEGFGFCYFRWDLIFPLRSFYLFYFLPKFSPKERGAFGVLRTPRG